MRFGVDFQAIVVALLIVAVAAVRNPRIRRPIRRNKGEFVPIVRETSEAKPDGSFRSE